MARSRTTRKFRSQPTEVGGIKFPSKKEAKRWVELQDAEARGVISDLKRQVRFRLDVNGVLVCSYVADFTYTNGAGQYVVEDSKGFLTPVYRLKRKMMKACHGITILET